MPFFLFAKQIVDMLYQFKILDYGMVLLAVMLLGDKIWKEKLWQTVKEKCVLTDKVVLCLGVIYVISFLRYPALYGTFFKVESCFLIYFLGRVYAKRIEQTGKYMAYAGYIVVYTNFVYRFYQFGWKFTVKGPEETLLNAGGLYYYKTDLAFGLLIATLFIYLYAENNWFKWLTIVVISGYMIFYSGARMGKGVMCAVYALMIGREYAIRHDKKMGINRNVLIIIMNGLMICLVLFFIGIQLIPFENLQEMFDLNTELGKKLDSLMHSRHIIWTDILNYFKEQNIITTLLGVDLGTEHMHTSVGMRSHSLYIKQIYSTGYLGCMCLYLLARKAILVSCNNLNNKFHFAGIIVWIALLGFGFSIESLEATQMSWFPMLFLGMIISEQEHVDE